MKIAFLILLCTIWYWDTRSHNYEVTEPAISSIEKNNLIEHPLLGCWGRLRPISRLINIFSESTWIDVSIAVWSMRVRFQLLTQIARKSFVLDLLWFKTYCPVACLVSLEIVHQLLSHECVAIAISCISTARVGKRGKWSILFSQEGNFAVNRLRLFADTNYPYIKWVSEQRNEWGWYGGRMRKEMREIKRKWIIQDK